MRSMILLLVVLLLSMAAPAEKPWPLAVRLMSYGDFQEAAWEHLPKIGVKHVFMGVPATDEADAVIARLKQHGLDTPVLRGQADLTKDSFAQELEPQLAVCAKMGARHMFISAKRETAPLEDAYRRLREAGEVAKKYGVIITMETHPDLGTNGEIQLATMKAIDHPNVRVNFDTANITYYNENTNAQDELAKSVEYVATVEFKDHNGLLKTWDFPVVGKGMVDFKAIVALLRKNNYCGPVTIEFEGTEGVKLDEAQTLQAITDSVAYVRTLGSFD